MKIGPDKSMYLSFGLTELENPFFESLETEGLEVD